MRLIDKDALSMVTGKRKAVGINAAVVIALLIHGITHG